MPPPLSYDVFYKSILKPGLKKAEDQRKQIIINYTIISIVLTLGFVLEAVTWMSIGIAIVVIFVLAYTHSFGISRSEFNSTFQSIAAKLTGNYLIPEMHYDYSSYHKLKNLNEALLVNGNPKQYNGMHMISYREANIAIGISEIECHNNKQDSSTQQSNIFKGLAGIANMTIDISDPIVIMTDNLPGDLWKDIDTEMSDPVSKDEFIIYNLDHSKLNKWMSPSTWLLLKKYSEKNQKSLFISIYKTGICVAIESVGYMQPALLKSVYKKEFTEPFYNDLEFIYRFLQLFCKNYQTAQMLKQD